MQPFLVNFMAHIAVACIFDALGGDMPFVIPDRLAHLDMGTDLDMSSHGMQQQLPGHQGGVSRAVLSMQCTSQLAWLKEVLARRHCVKTRNEGPISTDQRSSTKPQLHNLEESSSRLRALEVHYSFVLEASVDVNFGHPEKA